MITGSPADILYRDSVRENNDDLYIQSEPKRQGSPPPSRSAVTQIGARKFIQHVLHDNMTMPDHENLSLPVSSQVFTTETAPRPMRVFLTR